MIIHAASCACETSPFPAQTNITFLYMKLKFRSVENIEETRKRGYIESATNLGQKKGRSWKP